VKLIIRGAAREDILRQYSYYLIEKDAEMAAERFTIAVHAAITQVSKHPEIEATKAFSNKALRGLRSWPIKGFPAMRVYYLSSGDVLRIIRVLHGKRDLNPLLEAEPED
jgi:toxin ParE1/3/4